ncbi:MAG TPA: periplasmic heavy metal sensor [Terriglobales bacterium]|nr:periplasmic heavy metal sensor [Terriglobales bacterium]
MKTRFAISVGILVLAGMLQAQETAPAPPPPGGGPHGMGHKMIVRHEMGKWWQNPDVASKLQLSDAQVSQLNQVFYNHKLKLIDYGAEMEKQDLKLQNLLDADQPDENQVSSQVDQVLAARGKLEREFTMMNLDLRKQLTLAQWRQLKTMHGGAGGPGNKFFMRFKGPGPGGPGGPAGADEMPPLPPPPPGLE